METRDIQKVFLSQVIENIQASERVIDFARNLHLEALNARIGTAQLGEGARTFVPIAAEISDRMKALRSQTETYKTVSEEFIDSIALQVKLLRLGGLFKAALQEIDIHGTPTAQAQAAECAQQLSEQFSEEVGHCIARARKNISELEGLIRVLRQTVFSGKYTSEVALIESSKIVAQDGRLGNSATSMARQLSELTGEIKKIDQRLIQAKENLKGFEQLRQLCAMEAK